MQNAIDVPGSWQKSGEGQCCLGGKPHPPDFKPGNNLRDAPDCGKSCSQKKC